MTTGFDALPDLERRPPAAPLPDLALDIAYQAPKRAISRVLLCASGTADTGYDSIDAIENDHIGTLNLKDVGIHVYINRHGDIEWGRSLERAPEFPHSAAADDLVILMHGHENSLEISALNSLRALLPVINAIHGNALIFEGLPKHHARLGIGRDGRLIEVALQAPPEL